jgi:hypothetical protein
MKKNILLCLVIVLSGFVNARAETDLTYQYYPGASYTYMQGISGNSFVGYYKYGNASGGEHGFLYDGTNWITIDYPGATATYPKSISGGNIVGTYTDSTGEHGFFYNGTTWTKLVSPEGFPDIDLSPCGISGNNIVGYSSDAAGQPIGFLYTIQSVGRAPIVGDLDGDYKVDFADYAILASHWLESRAPVRIVSFSLDTNPNWSTDGQWQFGQPTGSGGSFRGYPDPNQGFTGQNVYGVNLNGDYTTPVGGPYWLEAGPFDCTGYTSVSLNFARWLNTDTADYVKCMVEVSNGAGEWQIWVNRTDTLIADNQWQQQHFDISSIADNQAAVYIRWGYQILNNRALPYSGWNIDDINLEGWINQPPQSSDLGTKARLSSLVSSLQTVRSAIELYKIQHNDNLPGCSGASFEQALTCYTDLYGNIMAQGSAGALGPYVYKIPINPFTGINTVTVSASDATGSAIGGWHFNTVTGKFQADDTLNTQL